MTPDEEFYGPDVALVHQRSGGAHAAACGPEILDLLCGVHERDGLVLELGCGSGALTELLIAAGHRVIATDAAPPMVALASELVGAGAQEVRQLTLPHDPLPTADAIVAVGRPLNYLASPDEIEMSLSAIARALRPGGVLAIDMCDLEWGRVRTGLAPLGRTGEDWAIITEFGTPSPDRFTRDITTFLPNGDGSWRRSQEHHDSVLVDTTRLPALLAALGVDAVVSEAFGGERLPDGLRAVTGRRRDPGA